MSDLNNDEYGQKSKENFENEGIDTTNLRLHNGTPTNYHYVLWYKDERTILVKHYPYRRELDESTLPDAEYVYLSSLGADSLIYHDKIVAWLRKNPASKLVFQPGTFQMQIGKTAMSALYRLAHVFVCNVEEAQYILETKESDVKKLMMKMHMLGPKIVLITNGPNGAYLYHEQKAYFMPIYPDIAPPYERTGAGDAFTATFTSALAYGLSPVDALRWAPINSMSVVQKVGAQEGLLTKEELQKYLQNAPTEYYPKEI
jgi:sugar/nucleoside kinase (ribokinase family)